MSALKTFIDTSRLREDLSFSEHNLSDAFQTQSAMFADYSRRAAEASHQEDRLKQARDILEARIDNEIRTDATAAGEKLTEAMIAKKIRLDPRYQRAQARRNEGKMIADLCKGACEAFRQRRDLLIQAGADAREEFKGSMRMKSLEAEAGIKQSRTEQLKNLARART